MEPFYYQHLEKSEQTIYHAIKTGVTALEDHFLVPYADPARISMIFFGYDSTVRRFFMPYS